MWCGNFSNMSASKKVYQVLNQASELLLAVSDNALLESEILLSNVMQHPRVYFKAHPEQSLTENQITQFFLNVRRRLAGEPLPYITGRMEFYGLSLLVTPDVLIPRPETELLVDLGSVVLKNCPEAVVLDVGTGSGCIAIAIAKTAMCKRIYATDISYPALTLAKRNARAHAVLPRIQFLHCDLLMPIRMPVEVIISNPPYISEKDYGQLPVSVRHEPATALLAGDDGLRVVSRLLKQASLVLHPKGLMLVEIGAQQGNAVQTLARTAFPNASIHIHKDLAGLDRVLQIQGNS